LKEEGPLNASVYSMPTVYVETTIPSYLTSRPSRDLVVAAHQQLTHDWWSTARPDLDAVVSEAVLDEIRAGDPEISARRLEIVQGLPILSFNDAVKSLAKIYSRRLGLHPDASTDIIHIAFAVAYEIDYLVTWNCKHIANGHVIRRLQEVNKKDRRATPVIVTPEEMLDKPIGETS